MAKCADILCYVVTHDTGFAPNPYGGFLTLATCKPRIRRIARPGEAIVGTGSVKSIGADRVVYAAEVARVVPIGLYGREAAYAVKRPKARGDWWEKDGDNLYAYDGDRVLVRASRHHPRSDESFRDHDLSGRNVLICDRFWYFGRSAPRLPVALHGIVKRGPHHKRTSDPDLIAALHAWLRGFNQGIHDYPAMMHATPGCLPRA